MSKFASQDQYDEWDQSQELGFATSSFASMPSAPSGKQVTDKDNGNLNASDFFLGEEDDEANVNNEIIYSNKYNYQNIHVLGRGAFATCFLSRRNDNLYVCMKQLDNNLKLMSTEEKEKIFGEIQALKTVSSHENVTHLYESFETKGHILHVCLEYCSGNTLADLIQETLDSNQILSDRKIKEYTAQIFIALKYIHEQKIIHRDMKPANILLTGQNGRFLKIADFGISKLSAATMAMSIVGTPYYLAPELCEGHEYGYKADLWATGIILYEMCNLKRPFDASSLPALIMKIMKVDYEPVFTTKLLSKGEENTYNRKGLIKVIHALLNKMPDDRPSAVECCDVFKADINTWLGKKQKIVDNSSTFAQACAQQIEAAGGNATSHKSTAATNSTLTMKTMSSANNSLASSLPNDISQTVYRTPKNNNNMNTINDKTNYKISPFEARHVREKMSNIISNHPRLWRVGTPNPKMLHEFLHIHIDKLIMGGITSEDVEDYGSPNENSIIALPKLAKMNGNQKQEVGLLGFGINKSHQLGFNSNGREVKESMPVNIIHKELGNINAISSGDGFSAMIDGAGKLFLVGDLSWIYEKGELGLCKKEEGKDVNPFRRSSDLSNMSFGSTSNEKMVTAINGNKINYNDIEFSDIPLNVSAVANYKIRNVVCGSDFAILLDQDGKCFSFGKGDEGVLGLTDDDDRSKPTLIDSISDIHGIRCGARHVLAKSKNCIYSWGSNTYGQLGLGNGDDYDNDGEDNDNNNDINDDFLPKEIIKLNGSSIIQFECGLWHNAVILSDGSLYTWGMNESGQLGLGKGVGLAIDVPTINEFFQDEDEAVVSVSCGAFHTACITEGSLLYGFGSNKQHCIGQKVKDKNYPTPTLIKSFCSRKYIGKSVVSKVFCGIHRTYVLADVGYKENDEDD
jgi:serine/threonine protein kinase/alpha-tubulin suppressor-like RCC1 family protein